MTSFVRLSSETIQAFLENISTQIEDFNLLMLLDYIPPYFELKEKIQHNDLSKSFEFLLWIQSTQNNPDIQQIVLKKCLLILSQPPQVLKEWGLMRNNTFFEHIKQVIKKILGDKAETICRDFCENEFQFINLQSNIFN